MILQIKPTVTHTAVKYLYITCFEVRRPASQGWLLNLSSPANSSPSSVSILNLPSPSIIHSPFVFATSFPFRHFPRLSRPPFYTLSPPPLCPVYVCEHWPVSQGRPWSVIFSVCGDKCPGKRCLSPVYGEKRGWEKTRARERRRWEGVRAWLAGRGWEGS